MADSTVHVAIQIVISRGHCILIQCTALSITTLFAVFYSRKFNGCYNFHIVLSFVYLVVLCLNVWLGATAGCCFVIMKHLTSKVLSRKDKCLVYGTHIHINQVLISLTVSRIK